MIETGDTLTCKSEKAVQRGPVHSDLTGRSQPSCAPSSPGAGRRTRGAMLRVFINSHRVDHLSCASLQLLGYFRVDFTYQRKKEVLRSSSKMPMGVPVPVLIHTFKSEKTVAEEAVLMFNQ